MTGPVGSQILLPFIIDKEYSRTASERKKNAKDRIK